MNTMQQFHAWLERARQSLAGPAPEALARLTQATPAQLRAFENDMSWETWGSADQPPAGVPSA
jgi:hypothetical protein